MQNLIDKMRGPLTCLVVFALMVMTPFADPQIALASDYVEYLQRSRAEVELLENNRFEWYADTKDVSKSVEGQMLAMTDKNAALEVVDMSEMTDVSMMTELDDMDVVMEAPVVEVPVEEVFITELLAAEGPMEEELMEEMPEAEALLVEESAIVEEAYTPRVIEYHYKEYTPLPKWRISITNEQLDLLERCVMAEGGGETYECQVAIACVIINRVLSDNYPDNIDAVIKQKGQFSTWPKMIQKATASNQVKQAVREALTSEVIPENVLYFRANRYHKWGNRYCRIDNTYFSTP